MKTDKYTIIKTMLSEESTFTYQQLAQQLHLSNKTIRNQIYEIEKILNQYQLQCLRHPGVGLQIQGKKENLLACYHYCVNQIKNSKSLPSSIRKNIIIFTLLTYQKKISMRYLEDLLYITRPSIYNDLKEIESFLSTYDIQLTKSRKSGLQLIAGEKRKRRCLLDWSLSMRQQDIDVYHSCPELILFLKYLFDDQENGHRSFLKNFITHLDQYSQLEIAPDELERIITLFLISFTSIQKGIYVNINQDLISKIRNSNIIEYFKSHKADLNLRFSMQLTDNELIYLSSLLSSTLSTSYHVTYKESTNPQLLFKVIDLYYETLINTLQPFDKDYFKVKLFPFLEKVMQKSNFINDVYTPLHDEILSLYPKLYAQAQKINPIMFEHLHEQLNDSGVATLTLLLATIKEKQTFHLTCYYIPTQLLFDDDLKINILKRNIPNLHIITDEKIAQSAQDKIDFIITHQPINSTTHPTFTAPPLFTKEFINLLKRSIDDILEKKELLFFENQ